ncbi:major facilitator superfamily transporter [Xylaria arbuscula]|nr:major facilitator superfamily transporter [Xylaria arbuscula]
MGSQTGRRIAADAPASQDNGVRSMEVDDQPSEKDWPVDSLSTLSEVLLVFVACMTQFCTQAAFAETLVLLHTIGESFGFASSDGASNVGQLAWLVSGFALTVGTFVLVSGRLGDVFGYKRMLLYGYAWFAVWSVVVGFSAWSDSYFLIVFARVLQGIGPATCLPNALAILGAVYPPGPKKAMIFALFGATAPVGAIVGAAIGAVTGVASLVLFNFAWNQAPVVGWSSGEVIVPLVLALVLFGLFTYIEKKVSKPLLPLHAISGSVVFILIAVGCGWAAFGVWILYLVQLLQEIRHLSPLQTVANIAPLAVAGFIAAIFTGILLGPLQTKPPILMILALASFTIGVTLIATVPPNQLYWGQIFVSTIIMPFGMDMSFPAATLILSDAVSIEHQGIAASLVNLVVNYSISLGVGFAGTVEVHVSHGDELAGFRGGLYLGVGVAGLGLVISLIFAAVHRKIF